MLKAYQLRNGSLKGTIVAEGETIAADTVWIDLFTPTAAERQMVNTMVEIELPTRADMEEIELSSRLYQEDGGIFMTALVLNNSESDRPFVDVVSFVLVRETLVSVRYIDPQPFRTFATRCERSHVSAAKAQTVLMAILDVIIDRLADVLEKVGAEIETVSRDIFDSQPQTKPGTRDFQSVLRRLGRKHDLIGKIRESLLTISRILTFLTQATDGKAAKDVRTHTKTLTRDVVSLQDHSSYLGSKLNYLLDATLGLINIDQNNIIKIMSVAAVVFLPPTLVASIYGMNFKFMPELSSPIGYPIAILIMVVSAVLPYVWFKWRGWL